ncbi:bifunctional oligoribonuclease/PAP phosphatase NrnA [Bacillus sp. FSL W7-1360]
MFEQMISAIKAYTTIVIHRHVRPDPDALGSQLGLKSLIQAAYPEKNVYAVGEEEVSLHFLGRMDVITDDVYKDALVIVCDTANTARISDERFRLGARLVKFDHHPNEEPYGDVLCVDTSVSSTSELVVALAEHMPELTMTKEASLLLYGGIVGDTGRFRFRNTTAGTMRRTALLLETGFDSQRFYRRLYERSIHMIRLEGYVLQHFEVIDGKVGFMRLSAEILKRFEVTANESSLLVNCFADLSGLQVWVFFVEEANGTIRCRLRSQGVVINNVAQAYGGGGHPVAAGASVNSWEETEEMVAALIAACS